MIEQKKRLKVSFANCPIPNRREVFRKSSCILSISVGQTLSKHEGEKFLATIKLVNASFKTCTVLIDDTVQRHTLKMDSNESDEKLYETSLRLGDEWFHRNKSSYDQLTIPHALLRWDYWLAHPDYSRERKIIDELYSNNYDYQAAMHTTIREYLARNSGRLVQNNGIDSESAFAYCLEYLKEECAVMCLRAQEEYGYDFDVYPTGRSAVMQATHTLAILPRYPNTIVSVSLRFKKYAIKEFAEEVESIIG